MNKNSTILVGDNPFHGISHLSQKRSRERSEKKLGSDVEIASQIVKTSLENGATGFMFSVSETTLSILNSLDNQHVDLYAIIPYAYEYVRLANRIGGVSNLAKQISKQIALSKNIVSILPNSIGIARFDPSALLKSYTIYEMSRIKSVVGKNACLKSVMIHEIITDMALAFNLDWLFKSYIKFLIKHKISPGFETRNFAYLVTKFQEWGINFGDITVVAPFNRIGFQMNPSRSSCETALEQVSESEIIAMSIFAAGHQKLPEAIDYVRNLPNLSGVVAGISTQNQAKETFSSLKQSLG
ncbi:hypothetical protein [Candidatus Bathycorpusculum sp.]|jgi:hypothetical protein|uniref:hypothetical protein n=1 Tax=Candidatus Bathycorpusculum sp. TaxID=2994959 RepID=UPI002838BC88|nr:hypothetical protein [Candidatus Termitimicrobium sp.]MCL2431586.1 hypothetical protein [Candidatus Termitimicrobium sp.]